MGTSQKLKVDIERLLSWAYREELPKKELAATGESSSWDAIARYTDAGGVEIDRDPWELHLRSQRYAGIGPPHDDALRLDRMVRNLDDVTVQWPRGRDLLISDMRSYETAADVLLMRRMKAQPAGLVISHARMGTRPIWNMEHRLNPVVLKNGKPLIRYVDRHGKLTDCHSGQRDYLRGGQCPLRLDPTVAEIASARFEYFVWRAALIELVAMANASWSLTAHEPQRPAAAPTPWLTGAERKSRVLPALQETVNHDHTSRETKLVES